MALHSIGKKVTALAMYCTDPFETLYNKGVDILLEDIETSWEKGILKEKDNVAYAVLDMDGDGKITPVDSLNIKFCLSGIQDQIFFRVQRPLRLRFHI